MSELTYKKIVDVEQVETLNDAATVFINDDGAMKQVAADKFGAVKTVNGVAPDENGEVYIGEQVAYLFADGTALVPDLYTWYGPGTLADAVGRLGTTNKEITEIHRLIMTPSGAGRMYKSIGHEKIKNADSSYNARILFGDNICPVIFDTVNNKIITDPDWVKPKESVQPDWNQNDPTAADYVKNRPFYTDGEDVVQIDEKYLPKDALSEASICELSIEVGKTTKADLQAIDGKYACLKVGPYRAIDNYVGWTGDGFLFDCIGPFGRVEVEGTFDSDGVVSAVENKFSDAGITVKGENGSDYLIYVDSNGALAVRIAGFAP